MTIEEALDMLEYGDWFQSVYNNLPESTANKVAEAIEALAKVVHIDRKKWEPCKCCREPIGAEPYAKEKYPEICDFEVILDGGDEITVNAYNHYTPVTEEVCFSFPVSFCPKCGRPLTDQAWAELEKRLRGMMA